MILKSLHIISFGGLRNRDIDLSGGVNLYVALNAFLLLTTAAYALRHSIQTKLYKKPVTLAAIPVLCVLLVIGAGALAFVNASVTTTT
jgi:hypothetical protein